MATVAREPYPGHAASHPFDYVQLYRAAPAERIRVIKQGVSASALKRFGVELRLDQQEMFGALNLKTATVNRKAARNEALSADESERVLGLAKLVGQLVAMVEESGEADAFDAPAWLSQWLRQPLPALAGDRPIALLDTMEGQALVARALAQVQSGAYA